MKKLTLSFVLVLLSLSSCTGNTKEDTLKGFDIDLAKEACALLNITPVFQEIVWEQKETELSSKQIDLIWNGLTITDERKESLSISIPYMANSQVMVVKNSFNDDSITAEDKYNVAFEDGSAGQDTFNDNEMFSGSKGIPVSAQTSALTEVLSGTSDIAIIDSVMAGYYLKSNTSYGTKLKILSDYDFTDEYYGIAGRKEDSYLMAKINEALDRLYTSGKTAEIASTYGLSNDLVSPSEYAKSSDITDSSSWDYIESKGKLVIGYTIFAPIAFED